MVELRVQPIRAESGPHDPVVVMANRVPPVMLGVCLLLLLAFCTATVFVPDAWALQSFQIGIFVLLVVYFVAGARSGKSPFTGGLAQWFVYAIPIWGLVQIAAQTTASTFETRASVLRWAALAGVFFLSQALGRTRSAQRAFLSAFLFFATAMSLLCLFQLSTSGGRVLWIFPTAYPEVFATFQSSNSYAQFIELALPIALWRALLEGWRSWWYAPAGAFLYASVIGSASRTGTALCTAELLAMLIIGFVKFRDPATGLPTHATKALLAVIPALAVVFALCVGWESVWHRFQQDDPFRVRREFVVAAVDMAKQRPLTGYGLGTFPKVYQQHAIKDFPFYANHAHNDWAEFAAEGGVPFLLLVLIPFAVAIPAAIRNPWGLGLIAIMLHACDDFPFPRPAVSGWLFAILGLLYMARMLDRNRLRIAGLPSADVLPPVPGRIGPQTIGR